MESNTKQRLNSLFEFASEYAENPAILTPDRTLTYCRYAQLVLHTLKNLRKLGLKKGDILGILAPNSVEYVIFLTALWRIGVVVVPLSTRWPAKQIESSLHKIACPKIFLPKETEVKPGFQDIESFYLEELFDWKIQRFGQIEENELQFDFNHDATIMFTSGSSGSPKAVLHNLGSHYYSALGSDQNIVVERGDRWLLSLPLCHVGGLAILFRSFLGGGAVAVPPQNMPLEDAIRQMEITHISLVATQLYRLLKNKGAVKYLKKMKAVLLGGGSFPVKLIQQAAELDLPIFTSYGSTEMSSQITTSRPWDSLDRLQTSGKLLSFRDMKITSDGEILVKGPTLFKGYAQDGELKKETDAEGWFHTGDAGCLDEEGYLHVTGRKDNMFISGGENIQPEEIERMISQMEDVAEVLVVPVKNEEFGDRPVAFVKMAGRMELNSRLIKRFLEKRLPRFKIPDYFFSWPSELKKKGIKYNREECKSLVEKILKKNV